MAGKRENGDDDDEDLALGRDPDEFRRLTEDGEVPFNNAIHRLRDALGVSQREAAAQAGISGWTLHRIEQGKTKPTRDILVVLCTVPLGLNVEQTNVVLTGAAFPKLDLRTRSRRAS